MKLTASQLIALRVVSGERDAALARFKQVDAQLAELLAEAGLEPDGNYEIAADGTVTVSGGPQLVEGAFLHPMKVTDCGGEE